MFLKLHTPIILSLLVSASVLSACQTTQKASQETPTLGVNGKQIEITGGIIDMNQPMPIISNDPDVKVFPLDGPIENPLTETKYNGVLDNTTAGGYTVFDESVKVYPLPGQEVPAFVPAYAVPPLKSQYKEDTPLVGERLTSLSESSLPPVPTVDVGEAKPFLNPPISGAVRQPLTLTAPEPVTLQPPTNARPPMSSPFEEAGNDMGTETPRGPLLTGDAPEPVDGGAMPDAAPAAKPGSMAGSMTAGRRSGPSLTGY